LFKFVIKYDRDELKKIVYKNYYWTLCESNVVWHKTGGGSTLTNIIFTVVINGQRQELRVQSRYLMATPRKRTVQVIQSLFFQYNLFSPFFVCNIRNYPKSPDVKYKTPEWDDKDIMNGG